MRTHKLALCIVAANIGMQIPASAEEVFRIVGLSTVGTTYTHPAVVALSTGLTDKGSITATLVSDAAPSGPEAAMLPSAEAGYDVSRADVGGVRLYMTADEARVALSRSLPGENIWRDTPIPCADERVHLTESGQGSCLATSVLSGPTGVVLRFVEDLPSRPHHSIVTEIVLSHEPVRLDSKRRFHQALLNKYGSPNLRDTTGMQWGRVMLQAGQTVLLRTFPMLESSNDEIIRLSDTGLEEREAALADAKSPVYLTGGPGPL